MNYKLLQQDVKFPLNWCSEEYRTYIFDSQMNMVAMVYMDPTKQYHPFEKLIGDMKEVKGFNSRYYLYKGDFYDTERDDQEPIGCVRGWGRLQNRKSPSGEKRQDNIAEYILRVINNVDIREQALIEMMQADERDGLYNE